MHAPTKSLAAERNGDHLTEKVEALLADLTLEEKVSLCHAGSKFATNGVGRLGIQPLVMSDGPHGVRQEFEEHSWKPREVDWDTATYLPTGAALAATWNPKLARTFGRVLGAEARARGKDVLLGPGFNIVRDPRCGRNFEYLGEDPCLIRGLAPEIIQGIQEQGVAACAKHFAMNNQEWNRGEVDARPEERAFREIYAPGFEAAVECGVWTVMGAYNKFRGEWCCQNEHLLTKLLKEEWGFSGAVISDWCALHGVREAATGGLDIEMGTSDDYSRFYLAEPFLELLRTGQVSADVLDDKVRRILRVHFLTGKMGGEKRKAGRAPCTQHARVAREVAVEAPVLLQNDGLLPLDISACRTIAVIGENAVMKHGMGGGSSAVKAPYEITPLEGIRGLLGSRVEVRFARGYPDEGMPYPAIPAEHMEVADAGSGVRGWHVTWLNAHWIEDIAPANEIRESAHVNYDRGVVPVEGFHPEVWSAIFRGALCAPESGRYVLALRADSDVFLAVDGKIQIESRQNHHRTIGTCEVEWEKGQTYQVEITYRHCGPDACLQLGWALPGQTVPTDSVLRAEALQAAREADAVLFFGGLNHLYDNEGGDRSHIGLPAGQDNLIRELVKANPRTVVTLIAGAPVEMPWANEVPAILYGWYAGMEAGRALADLIFGRANPSGKLPFTLPRSLADTPAARLDDYAEKTCAYREGIFTGYRWYDREEIEPLFPFGHGLGYSPFLLDEPKVEEIAVDGEMGCRIRCRLRNTGKRPGQETVQLYVGQFNAPVPRPIRELKGFRKVHLAPGKSRRLEFWLKGRDFSYWDEGCVGWKQGTGSFSIELGFSSRDIRIARELVRRF